MCSQRSSALCYWAIIQSFEKCTFISIWNSGAELEPWDLHSDDTNEVGSEYVAPTRVAKEKKRIFVQNVNGIAAMDFSYDGRLLAAALMDKTHTINIYEWEKKVCLVSKGTREPCDDSSI